MSKFQNTTQGLGLITKKWRENVIATGWKVNVWSERCISNNGMSQEVEQIREEYEVKY